MIWWFWLLVFNATFSNISPISWRPVLVVEEAGVPGENHRPWASNWSTCSCRVFSSYEYGAWHDEDIYNLGIPYSKLTLAWRVLLVTRELLTGPTEFKLNFHGNWCFLIVSSFMCSSLSTIVFIRFFFTCCHCIICRSSMYGLWSSLWYLPTLFIMIYNIDAHAIIFEGLHLYGSVENNYKMYMSASFHTKRGGWVYKASLTPPHVIVCMYQGMTVERSCICMFGFISPPFFLWFFY